MPARPDDVTSQTNEYPDEYYDSGRLTGGAEEGDAWIAAMKASRRPTVVSDRDAIQWAIARAEAEGDAEGVDFLADLDGEDAASVAEEARAEAARLGVTIPHEDDA